MTPAVLKEIEARFRAIPGARTDTRALRDVLEREVAALRDAHRAGAPWAMELAAAGGAEPTADHAREAIARFHWFATWADATAHADQPVDPRFEAAADAIVAGDAAALRALLAADRALVGARSPFAHHATLLHHVAANGIEVSRQWQSPPNAVEIARVLLHAGADPDATCDAYAPPPGAHTPLTLLVSSVHPARAGVQVALVAALLDAGAAIDGVVAGPSPIETAVRFGYPAAAEALSERGARVDNVVVAAGLGRLELVRRFVDRHGARGEGMDAAYRQACAHGRTAVAAFLLRAGVDVAAQDHEGFTGLHWAAFRGHAETVRVLAEAGAPLEVKNLAGRTEGAEPAQVMSGAAAEPPAEGSTRSVGTASNLYGGTVLACTVWASVRAGLDVDHVPVVAELLAAGADLAAVPPYPSAQDRVDTLLRSARALVPRARRGGRGVPHAVALVPGFLGFEHDGALTYFADRFVAGVRGAIEARVERPVPVVPVTTLAVGSLASRQLDLCRQLANLEQALGGKRVWHLVGHSTGGLDAALLLRTHALVDGPDGSEFGSPLDTGLDVASVVTISAPHYGTGLAREVAGRLARLGHGIKLLADVFGAGGDLVPRVEFFAASARTSAYDFLFHDALARDLMPPVATRLTSADNRTGRPVFSIATCAPAPTAAVRDSMFRDLYRWAANHADAPAPAIATGARWISAIGALPLDQEANDGVVNTLRQLDGTVAALVAGDHADVIGRYRRVSLVDQKPFDGGLLESGARFGDDEFFDLLAVVASCLEQGIAAAG